MKKNNNSLRKTEENESVKAQDEVVTQEQTTATKKRFYFPTLGKTVEASSLEEAEAIIKSLTK